MGSGDQALTSQSDRHSPFLTSGHPLRLARCTTTLPWVSPTHAQSSRAGHPRLAIQLAGVLAHDLASAHLVALALMHTPPPCCAPSLLHPFSPPTVMSHFS
ncbi:hypothetical protein FS749_011030 [Ceratobasidium sp. UAMH 11750]|nr:hypothetical protein FS749_011030 [Ceratobasidium sp. UAMH 11750]